MLRLLPAVLLYSTLIGCFLSGCSPSRSPACPPGEITAFFTGPSAARLETLAACRPDTAAYNRAFRSCRARPAPGVLREVLTDTAGVPFHLGWKTPRELKVGALYPLVIYLHGGIGTERIDKGDSAFLMLEPLADTPGVFVASPSANRYAPWWSPYGLSRILQTLRFLALRYPVDPDRVFLAGVSDGATGCYAAANTIPGPFAGFIAVSGFGGMLPTLGMPLHPGNLMRRPIYNVNAGRDHLYPVEQVKQFVAALQEQGVRVKAQWYPDEKHGFDYRAMEMPHLADLVSAWRRPPSDAVSWTFVPGFPNMPAGLLDWSLTSDNAFVLAAWRGDTLLVRTAGVASFTLVGRDAPAAAKIICRFPDNGSRARKFPPMENAWPEQLRLLESTCVPEFRPAVFYRILAP
jgi:acetyl esterase/lipase